MQQKSTMTRLKLIIPLLLSLCTLSACQDKAKPAPGQQNSVPEANAVNISPSDTMLRYTGRWLMDNPQAPQIGWQGSTVEIKIIGTAVSVELDAGSENEQFRVVIDGIPAEQTIKVVPGRSWYVLAKNLNYGSHHIALMKETFYGSLSTFYGFDIYGGVLEEQAPLPAFKIDFFGDSNMDGTSLYSEKDSGDSGTYYAYPAVTARMLNAQFRSQSNGGATLTENGYNNVLDFIASRDKINSDLDYRDDYFPQVIVVNAGANDIYKIHGNDLETEVKSRFIKVHDRLREVYGDGPHIVFYNAYGWDLNEPANYSKELINEFGGNVSVLHYPWMWEQWHGSMIEHAGQARLLAKHIASLDLGFTIVKQAEVFDGFGHDFDVANGSFEFSAKSKFPAFGWRYAGEGVERIYAPEKAVDGQYFLRLSQGQQVHQGTDASGDFQSGGLTEVQHYVLKAMIRSQDENGVSLLMADFEEQALYKRANGQQEIIEVTQQWQEYEVTFSAPVGSWKTYISLKAQNGTIDFDNVRMIGLAPKG
jgi:lysophospholipase L1-like esterase